MSSTRRAAGRAAAVKIPKDVVYREIDGEFVILDLKRGRYYGLAGVAAEVWRGLSRKTRPDRIRDRIVEKYRVGMLRADRDVRSFLAQLRRKGLLQ